MPKFFTTSVEKKAIAEKIRENPSLLKALKDLRHDITELNEYAHKQLTQKQDDFLTIQIIGEQGSGKSGVGQVLAVEWARIPFTAQNINLQYAGFFDNITRLQNGEFAILDEQTVSPSQSSYYSFLSSSVTLHLALHWGKNSRRSFRVKCYKVAARL